MLDHRSHVHSNLLDKYCRFCKQTFSAKANLIEHMKRVHNSDDISKAHIKMKNGDSIFIVAEDIKDFSDTFASQETTLPKQYSCITCKKSFQTKKQAKKHILSLISPRGISSFSKNLRTNIMLKNDLNTCLILNKCRTEFPHPRLNFITRIIIL